MSIQINNTAYPLLSTSNRQFIGWHSVVPSNGFSAQNFDGGAPSNLWSPDTYTGFVTETQGKTFDNYYVIMSNPNSVTANYLAIAGLSFTDIGDDVLLSVEYSTDGGSIWSAAHPAVSTENESVLIFYFNSIDAALWRLNFQPGAASKRGSVTLKHIKLGQALILERPTFVGDRPENKQIRKVTNRSDTGRYLGSTLVSENHLYSINELNNSNSFIRGFINDFLSHCNLTLTGQEGPLGSFFYAMRPEEFPADVYYCHAPDSIEYPENQRSNGMMQWSISGVAER